MELLDSLNQYLMSHPDMINQLETSFRIKYWVLLGLSFVFLYLPIREQKIRRKKQKEQAKSGDHFLA